MCRMCDEQNQADAEMVWENFSLFEALYLWLRGERVRFKLNVNDNWLELEPSRHAQYTPIEFTNPNNDFQVLI